MLTGSFSPSNAMSLDPAFAPYTFGLIFNFVESIFQFFVDFFPYILGFFGVLILIYGFIIFTIFIWNFYLGRQRRPTGSSSDPIYFIKEDKPVYYISGLYSKMPVRLQKFFVSISGIGHNEHGQTTTIVSCDRKSSKNTFISEDDPFL